MPVLHVHLRRRFLVRVPFVIEKSNAYHVLERLRAHRAGIHPQRAANRPGNSFHPFQSAEPRRFSGIRDLF